MNRKPHSFDISCSYKVSGNKTKKKLGTSKLEGYITLEDGKSHIRLPMRSFVRSFIDRLYDILSGSNSSQRAHLHTASITVSATASTYRLTGILLGNGLAVPTITSTDLNSIVSSASYGCEYKAHSFLAPYALSDIALRTSITRLITNASGNSWTIREVGIKTRRAVTDDGTAATSASNVDLLLVSLDAVNEVFSAATDKQVQIAFQVGRDSTNGGAVLNLLRVIYNLYLHGNANYSPFIPRVGTVTVAHASASATSHLVCDAIAAKYWGIVVGLYETITTDEVTTIVLAPSSITKFQTTVPAPSTNPAVGPDDYNFAINVVDLTYGANTISAVGITGKQATFTISRDITNGGTASVRLNRIGLVTKGATAAPTTLQDDQIFLMINRSATDINIAPNQTIRVEYKFQVQGD